MIHIFTEEFSIKNVFETILPKILPEGVAYRIYSHQGKGDLEKALTKTIPSISKIPDSKILILWDQDNEDCIALKKKIQEALKGSCSCDFYIRIVCRELESWFLGDLSAVEKAFPRFKAEQYEHKVDLRNVDLMVSPSNYLRSIIPDYSSSKILPKLEVSGKIAPFMNIEKNTSTSFNHTIQSIKKLILL